MLVPAEVDSIAEEADCKNGAVGASSSSNSKMIFTLLTKVITLYIKLTIVEVWEPGF